MIAKINPSYCLSDIRLLGIKQMKFIFPLFLREAGESGSQLTVSVILRDPECPAAMER